MFLIIVSYFLHLHFTQLWCGRIYNNRIIANCLQSVQVKELRKSVNMGKSKVPRFYGPQCI